ncbi:MAG: glycosyltransferase family 2 protein [Sphingobacteriaceae bacterium]|nr:glycosyltransferase family 2 protein [Sphingobacteriaceae bacterium]
MKRISVCMPMYNGERYLEAQLLSILDQLDESDEIIISDDGSTDGSRACIEAMQDRRIRIIQGPGAGNPSKNVLNALNAAEGNYIFLADQDDVWMPNKVSTVLEQLKSYDLVVHNCTVTNEHLEVIAHSFFDLHGSRPGFWQNWWRNHFLGCCMAFRREVLNKALPFPAAIPMHDSWLGLVATAWYRTTFIPETLLLYRRHGQNASSTSAPSTNSFLAKLTDRFWLLSGFILTLWRSK